MFFSCLLKGDRHGGIAIPDYSWLCLSDCDLENGPNAVQIAAADRLVHVPVAGWADPDQLTACPGLQMELGHPSGRDLRGPAGQAIDLFRPGLALSHSPPALKERLQVRAFDQPGTPRAIRQQTVNLDPPNDGLSM